MRYIIILFIFLMSSFAMADDIDTKFSELLSPAVRVTITNSGGGSGTVIYSEDREKKGEFQTFIITNHHVVAKAIHVEEKWDNLRQRYYKAENNEQVNVELFVYKDGKVVSSNKSNADIVAYNDNEDIAVLRLVYPMQVTSIAKLLPIDKNLRVFQEVYAVGCSLLHNPIPSKGEISSLGDLIDNRSYIMSTAPIIFGNSGGSVYTSMGNSWYFIGMPARVIVIETGALPHMNFFVPVWRIREFIANQKLDFLTDTNKTPTQCFEERKKLQDKNNNGPSSSTENKVENHEGH